ncbi:MAG: MarR family transcriptional regulator [Pseudomonadota bacterium]
MTDFDLENFLPYRLYQAAERASEGFHRIYGERFGLSRTEWRVLFNIGQYGPLSASALSKRAGFHKTQISRAVVRLENKRWVERVAGHDDRRTHDLTLTGEGKRNFQELTQLANEYSASLLSDFEHGDATSLLAQLRRIEACIAE